MLAYEELLNRAQYRVVSAPMGPMLVIAGAGTGKTRTIVFRLAWLVEHGVAPYNIVLLTFTRKAAREMLERAETLLGEDLQGLYGGTFHAFAFRILRQYKPLWLGDRPVRVLDSTDQAEILKYCRDETGIGKKERGFPKTPNILGLFSKARNKEEDLGRVIGRESPNMLPYAADLEKLRDHYERYKKETGVLDYDDLLFELEDLLRSDEEARRALRTRFAHILVDEYQDTNLVQARIVRLLAGQVTEDRSVMAVGDEAQSIYAFRGATVRNILEFPDMFPGTRIVALEENYRSVQPVLQVANKIMSHAREGYEKNLVAIREGGSPVRVVGCSTDGEQARCVARRVEKFLEDTSPSEIAVLFRSGYQSYQLEAELTALGIPFKKYGGLRFQEAAHVKDLLAYLHLVVNQLDRQSFVRVALMFDKVGVKTADKMYNALQEGADLQKVLKSQPKLFEELTFLRTLNDPSLPVADVVSKVMDLYEPHMQVLYPEDYPKRWLGLQEILAMAGQSKDLELFLAEMLLDSVDKEEDTEECVTLSTIHSAKGLEWQKVMVIDLVDGRLPSRFAASRQEVMEEERRLMYVACTRAKDILELYWFKRTEVASYGYYSDGDYCSESTFLEELDAEDRELCVGQATGTIRVREKYQTPGAFDEQTQRTLDEALQQLQAQLQSKLQAQTQLSREAPGSEEPPVASYRCSPGELFQGTGHDPAGRMQSDQDYVPALSVLEDIRAGRYTTCRHRVFGDGKILQVQDGDKLVVKFTMLGIKTILASYLFVKA